jgi:hypothetical protein
MRNQRNTKPKYKEEYMTTQRKAWVKKTPVEIILEQVAKQEEKVAALRKDLTKEEGELKKMQDATKMLQAK